MNPNLGDCKPGLIRRASTNRVSGHQTLVLDVDSFRSQFISSTYTIREQTGQIEEQ